MFVQLLCSLFYDFVSEAVRKYKCMIMLSKTVIGPGDLVKTVVKCLYNRYLFFLDIHVFTKHFDKMSSCHSF